MNTNIVVFCFAVFCVSMAVCVAFLCAAVTDLRKDLKADKQLFKIILDKTSEITNHCNKVMQLMDGTIDMLRKEHDRHNQAVDAMNETKAAADAMMSDFGELKDELDICRDQIVKLNTRLDEFDALKYIWNPATTTPYTIVNTVSDDPRSDITKQFSSLATAKTTEGEPDGQT